MLSDLDDFYCFAMVVEHGGFSAAERATDIPKSKLSRRVYNLEEKLGVRLIQRSSRHFAVTDVGMNVYRHAQVMVNAAQSAQDLVDHLSTEPRGTIKISIPMTIAQKTVAEILPEFLKQYPEIKIQMMITNRRVDIINEGIDIALRVRSNLDDDPNLIIRRLAKIEEHLYTTQAYLNEHGNVKQPDDLTHHRILSMREDNTEQNIIVYDKLNHAKKVKISPIVMASDLHMVADLVSQNCGIALLPDTIAQQYIDDGKFVKILPEWKAPHGIFHLVYPSKRGILPAVRIFIDYLVKKLSIP
ncbi:LysR substrate-binding domain-containing protein [Acinetobacter equi]|uniref:LysR family transcriptional regulator n=1 Tax=Acinetobacter equi TaxID=1324350 RepID=A0A0N9VFV6_9GAMM|nr:LysR substrate-binding domain-containing protein [Acinetobacter equi]ALH96242.1 LysR family transcriptional regulator [Acinetobacter equi]